MILTLKNNVAKILCLSLLQLVFFCATITHAEVSQTISVSPTLFDMTAAKEQTWQSELRVTNVNDYDITIYPQVVNFAPLGETGRGDFIPVFEAETKGKTLAEWIDLPATGITISRQETKTISFSVAVPADAAPGGHYAAILIGTKPPANSGDSQVQTAQFVTSLFFLRVAGEVSERGSIREFTTNQKLVQKPEVEFLLRFENEGNVHLQPQGDIQIFNMWGEERGSIPINQQTHFGNVLPLSIRQFNFSWSGEYSLFDVGRYQAIATLGYGLEAKNFVTSITYFWIIPWKQILGVLLFVGLLIWFVSFAVRLYVKRMLLLAGIEPRLKNSPASSKQSTISALTVEKTVIIKRYQTVTAPMLVGVSDLVMRWRKASSWQTKFYSTWEYIVCYRVFFAAVVAIGFLASGIFLYITAVTKDDRAYQVTINNQDTKLSLSSEQIIYDSLPATPAETTKTEQDYQITLSNASGKSGVAAKVRQFLETRGFTISEITTNSESTKDTTVIVYNTVAQNELLKLSANLDNALLSASSDLPSGSVVIYLGTDRVEN